MPMMGKFTSGTLSFFAPVFFFREVPACSGRGVVFIFFSSLTLLKRYFFLWALGITGVII